MNIIKSFFKELNILKYFYKDPVDFPGAIAPEREYGELVRLTDVTVEVAPVVWKDLDIKKIPKYPIYSQNGSSSCVAMSLALIATILYSIRSGAAIKFSPAWIYKRRSNSTTPGMIGTDAFNIASSKGICLEELMPSMDLSELAINSVKELPEYAKIAEVFAFDDTFVQLPLKDIDTVASVMQVTGKPVNVWFQFRRNEWTSIPEIRNGLQTMLHHSVVAIDYGVYQGEKSIAIQESWGIGATQFGAIRVIKESFFNNRNTFAAYPRRFKFEATGSKEIYDGTIVSFQKCMRSLGLFPVGVPYVENWGPLTRKSCTQFQTLQKLTVSGIIDAETKVRLQALFK